MKKIRILGECISCLDVITVVPYVHEDYPVQYTAEKAPRVVQLDQRETGKRRKD